VKNMRRCLFVFVLIICAAVSANDTKARQAKGELRVLFIGNSLTYSNDLPAIVEALAAASKQKRFIYKSIAFPDFGLQEQWERGEARKAIAREKWDVVVLQQGPSALEESRQILLEYTRRFDQEIRASGARTALYMVWPSEARFKDFERVIESYRLAADEVKGMLFPVGRAWREAWKRDAKMALYSGDRFHPSVAGSYLAALVIYEKLFARSSIGLPAKLRPRSRAIDRIDLSKEEADLLQSAAAEANKI
jgi:hypothetical protein